jgi:hypothetical protein
MKSCGRVRKLLSDYLEKELDQEIQKEIQEHIRFCTDCFEQEKTLRKVLSLSKELPESEPSPEFIYKFRQKLDRERFFVPAKKKVSLTRKWVWALPVTAAAALLIFILNMPQTKGPVEVAQEQPSASLPAQQPANLGQPANLADESLSATETPVEFVMDNWDRAALENLQRSGPWTGGNGVFRTSDLVRQSNPDWPLRVYVMPVVQNQTTGYKTRQPY